MISYRHPERHNTLTRQTPGNRTVEYKQLSRRRRLHPMGPNDTHSYCLRAYYRDGSPPESISLSRTEYRALAAAWLKTSPLLAFLTVD